MSPKNSPKGLKEKILILTKRNVNLRNTDVLEGLKIFLMLVTLLTKRRVKLGYK